MNNLLPLITVAPQRTVAPQMAVGPQMTVGHIAAEHLSGPRLFHALGIDYCCGGKQSLAEACASKNLDVNLVINQILDGDRVQEPDVRNWNTESLTDLVNHIESTHHARLKAILPWLSEITAKVERAHGKRNEKLIVLRIVFEEFKTDMWNHMAKEETVLFPLCRELDSKELRHAHDRSIGHSIKVMMAEHEHAGEALEQMRALTDGHAAPAWACGSYRAMLTSLKDLESDMHQHVHLENNILFPKAAAADLNSKNGRIEEMSNTETVLRLQMLMLAF